MAVTVTAAELSEFREMLMDYPEAIAALEAIFDCEGDLEDAAINLAIKLGQEPDICDGWLDGVAKSWRHVLCQPGMKEALTQGLTGNLLIELTEYTTLPLRLAVPVAIYVIKLGVPEFCHLFESKIQ
jgi:hypothetical protein